MNTHKCKCHNVEKEIKKDIILQDDSVNELQPLQVTGCTAGDIEFYNEVERSVECAVAGGTGLGPVGKLVELANQPSIQCMNNLIMSDYFDCNGPEIPADKRQTAYNNFVSVTGLKPVNWNHTFNHLNSGQKQILNFNAFYIFFPIFLLSMIAIWLMVGFGWINWIPGLFLSGLVFVILYGFSILYRIHARNFLDNQNQQLQQDANDAQKNFENSVAYFPQGLFAVACAVTATGTTGDWKCNEVDLSQKEDALVNKEKSKISIKNIRKRRSSNNKIKSKTD